MKMPFAALIIPGLLFSALSACKPKNNSDIHSSSSTLPPMEYADLCERQTRCIKISRLVMGTDHLGKMDNTKTVEVLNEAVRLGINTFDTSPIYSEGIEYRLGDWLKTQNRRDLFTISKGGFPKDLGPGTYSSRLKGTRDEIAAGVLEEVTVSNRQLNNNITVYLMHRDDADFKDYKKIARPQTSVKTILEALATPDIRSKFLMLGVSNWDTARVNESQAVGRENPNLPIPVLSSPYFSLLEMGSVTIHSGGVQVKHDDMINPSYEPGVKIMPYSPLGGFSIIRRTWTEAKRDALERKMNGDRYWGQAYDAIFHDANAKRFERALKFTDKYNSLHKTHYSVDQMLNAYVLAHKRTDYLAIGPRDVEQLRRTVMALQLSKTLTEADLTYLYQNE